MRLLNLNGQNKMKNFDLERKKERWGKIYNTVVKWINSFSFAFYVSLDLHTYTYTYTNTNMYCNRKCYERKCVIY